MGCVGGGVVSRVVGVATTKKKKKKRRDAQQNSHIHFTCYSFSVFFLVERVRSVQVIILMAGTRCVPWHSWAEWEFVADAFLRRRRRRLPEKDDDEKKKTEKKRRALELVQMWRTRGRVPVAVDAHAQIVELQLMDEELMMKKKKMMMMMKKNNPRDDGDGEDKKKETTTSNHQQSESTLRLSYAMTLTRLVNGICDQSQKGKFAVSVQTLATQLDVPRTLVDIRHDSTHNQLPSIQRLRKASEDAIEWLEVKYWERQKQKLERVVEEMRLAIRAMVECEKRKKKNKDGDGDGDDEDADGNKDSDSSDDESMYDSEEEMHMKTEKANKMKKEKETRKKTKNSAMGRLKRLVPKSKPDQMLVRAFTRELLDAHADERNNLVATNTTTEKERGKNNNANRGAADTVIVRAFSNVIEQIDSRVVNGFSCAVLEFGTEEVLHELANDARKIINPVFEFAWKHAVRRDEAKAKFIAQWYQRRDGANTTTYVQKKFQMLMSSSLEDATDGGGRGSNNNNNNNKNNNKKNAKKHKRQQHEKEDDTNNDTAAWRKAKPGEWVPGAPIGAPSRAIFVPREVVGGNNGVDKIVLELDAFTPRKKQKMEQRNASFSYRKNEFLDVDLEYNEDEEDGDDRLHSFLQDAAAADDDADDAADDEMGEEENEDAAKAKITVNGARVRLNDRDVNGVKDNVACLL